jgi:enterochelin esterase-like enzyme
MLQDAGQVPYAQNNRVAFMYRGAGGAVSWPGDFNGWNPSASSWQGVQQGDTDLVLVEKTFPSDARLDYKIVVNGNWILDPANPLQMWGGFGPNNELRMPDYVFPQETVRRTGVLQGNLTGDITTSSTNLGYDVNYRVYSPAGYDEQSLSNLPVAYVTDGHEYSADHLGSMVVVLDNLIDEGLIQPMMAVFIDPRDPVSEFNRRADQYTGNPAFASFVADELVAEVDTSFRSLASPSGRTILGTSFGGVNAAYFGGTRTDVFENIAVQSPSNFTNIFNLYATQSLQDEVDIFITAGTIGDGSGGPNFATMLVDGGYDFSFVQTNEGHSWGNWRALLDDILTNLVGPTPVLTADFDENGIVDHLDFSRWQTGSGMTTGATHADGDTDADRDSDGADFLAWQQQFGSGMPAIASSQTFPEPSTVVLLGGLAVVGMLVRRRLSAI